LRRRFARFKSATGRTRCGELGAHLLNLLVQSSDGSLHFFSVMSDSRLKIFALLRDGRLHFLYLAMLFEEFIEHGHTDAPGESAALDAFEFDLNWRMTPLEDEDLKPLWEAL